MRYYFLLFPLLLCSCDLLEDSKSRDGLILADTLDISIVRDETPGFPYPRMKHEIYFVGHLSVPGVIYQYSYHSQDVGYSTIVDYAGGYNPPSGTPFRTTSTRWSQDILPEGSLVSFVFSAFSSATSRFFKEEQIRVKRFTDGPQPVAGSIQLTGPDQRNYSPLYSQDGTWIYYRHEDANNREFIKRIPVQGGIAETVVETSEFISSYALSQSDSLLTYSVHNPDFNSHFIQFNLLTNDSTKTPIDGELWFGPLIPIPGDNAFISVTDHDYRERNLVRVDAEDGSVEILLDLDSLPGQIRDFSFRPHTRQVSVLVDNPTPYLADLLLLDIDTGDLTTMLSDIRAFNFAWAPNGEDYIVLKTLSDPGEPFEEHLYLVSNGVDRQLTTYPGEEQGVQFSPDGTSIVFGARRRGESQVWQLRL